MQSNGGLTTAEPRRRCPYIIESGPAAGVIGAQALARVLNVSNLITLTWAAPRASLVEGGEVTRSLKYQVGAGMMIGSRLLTGAGYLLKVPAIDLAEVGAGGGSLVWIDAGGSLRSVRTVPEPLQGRCAMTRVGRSQPLPMPISFWAM